MVGEKTYQQEQLLMTVRPVELSATQVEALLHFHPLFACPTFLRLKIMNKLMH